MNIRAYKRDIRSHQNKQLSVIQKPKKRKMDGNQQKKEKNNQVIITCTAM